MTTDGVILHKEGDSSRATLYAREESKKCTALFWSWVCY